MRRKKTHRHETRKRTATGGTKHGSRVRQRGRTRRAQKTRAHDVLTICVYKMSQQKQLLLLLLFVSRLRVRICGFVLPSFQVLPQFLPQILPQTSAPKDKRKTLVRDDDDNDDVFSNDDDDEFGVVLEITHQKTPIITAH